MLGRTDLVGRLATAMPSLANRVVGAEPRSLVRKALRAGHRRLRRAPAAAVRPAAVLHVVRASARRCASRTRQGSVAVFPTCLVEYQDPAIGQDLVKVYERNGIECTLATDVQLLRRAVAAQR